MMNTNSPRPYLLCLVIIPVLFIIPQMMNAQPAFILDSNGITIRCPDALPGETGTVNDVVYEAVNRDSLDQRIADGADLSKLCTTPVTDMSLLFAGSGMEASTFGYDITSWDVSNVTSMSGMFYYATEFNQPIGHWNVSNVTDMSSMFSQAIDFNQHIGDWDVSKVTDMSRMFLRDSTFNQPLDGWDVSNVKNMASMFWYAATFNQPIGNWNVSNVTTMQYTFHGATHFNQEIGNWDVSNVTNMEGMFMADSAFNQPLAGWDVSKVTDMRSMFQAALTFNQPIGDWNVSNVTTMNRMFAYTTEFNQPIGDWDVSKVTDMHSMFRLAASFNQDISRWCVAGISSEPPFFSNSSPLLRVYKPVWGTCPGGTSTERYPETVTEYSLLQNYPNPFNPSTYIRFGIPDASAVSLDIFSMDGRRMATIIEDNLPAGSHEIGINANGWASGIYMYRLRAGEVVLTRKMMLVK
jgi:surface protein